MKRIASHLWLLIAWHSLLGGTVAADFAKDSRKARGPLYCIMRDVREKRVLCLVSRDNGATWHDYAASTAFHLPYGIGGCREVPADGWIIGSFTELEGNDVSKTRGGKVCFFKIKAESVAGKSINTTP